MKLNGFFVISLMAITLCSCKIQIDQTNSTDPTPTPAPTPTSTTSNSCSGNALISGVQWVLGADGADCVTTCSAHGGFDAVATDSVGEEGDLANCQAVMTALCEPATSYQVGNVECSEANGGAQSGMGCFTNSSNVTSSSPGGWSYRCSDSPTTATGKSTGFMRACACNGVTSVAKVCPGKAVIGGNNWYLGADGADCDTTCESHGGYNALATETVGEEGTLANCQVVMTALCQPATSYDVGNVDCGEEANGGAQSGMGCFTNSSNVTSSSPGGWSYRCMDVPTKATGQCTGFMRACACNS